MASVSIFPPYPSFFDVAGKPLENGYIWIGSANLDPQVNPIAVYWDEALTIAADQPIRTLGGYPVRNGTPAQVFPSAATYSMRVQDKNGIHQYYIAEASKFDAALSASTGSSLVGFIQSGTGAVARSAQDKMREVVSVKDFGAAGDGVANDTSALQTFLNACAGKRGIIPAGTYIVNNLNLVSNSEIEGDGIGRTIIKRQASGTGNLFISASSKNDFVIRGIEFDGNRASQTNAFHVLTIDACEEWSVTGCRITGGKSNAGYGGGIAVTNGSNDTSIRQSLIRENVIESNDDAGVYANKESYLAIQDNLIRLNNAGVTVINFVFPPASYVQNYFVVTGNRLLSNTTAGVGFTGYYTGGTALAPIPGYLNPPQKGVVIADNICVSNGQYGIAYQGFGGTITGNYCERNGTTGADGGILVNAWATVCNNNVVHDNAFFGIDGGGSSSCQFNNNVVAYTGNTAAFPGAIAVNVGASIDCQVCNNVLENNGGSGGTSIYASGYEFGTGWFNQGGFHINISGNQIITNNSGALGILVANGFDFVTMLGNQVRGTGLATSILLRGGGNNMTVFERDNVDWTNGGKSPSISSAATLVIPDFGDNFFITGTTGITAIRTESANAFNQKVRFVEITNGGSGYNPASPPTVTFTGGGGTSAAGTALVSNSGAVIGVSMTNNGSGYTSAPTVAFSSGSAAGTARVGCDNSLGRTITLHFLGGLTVTNGGNLVLNGNFTSGGVGASILVLRGAFGNWYEISRRV